MTRMTPKKTIVVIVVSNMEFGGAQRQIVQLVNQSAGSDIDYHIISLSDVVPMASRLDEPDKLMIIKKTSKFDVTVIWRLASMLRNVGADIVHGYLFDAEIAARIAGRIAGTALVVGSERNTDYAMKRIHKIVYFLTKEYRQLCIANSRSGANYNARMLGYPSAHYKVIRNGVDSERFSPQDQCAAQESLGLDHGRYWLGMFASFKERKNHPLLLNAVAALAPRFPELRILLVGDTLAGGQHGSSDYKASILRLITELGLNRICTLLGNRTDVEKVYPACNVTVLPSHIEGTPNVALESMACGVPVIVTDVSDNAFVVPNNKVGLVVPPDDQDALMAAILKLMQNDDLATEFGVNARAWVIQNFSTEQLAEKTNSVYIAALNSSRDRPATREL